METGRDQQPRADHQSGSEDDRLRISEARLANALRIGKMGNFSMDLNTGEVWRSEEVCRIFGVSAFEPSLQGFVEHIHTDDRQRVAAAVNTTLEHHRPYSMEYRIVLPDGNERILHGRGEIVFDADGNATHLEGTVQDVTAQREAQAELENSRAELRELHRRLDGVREAEQRRIATEIHDDLGQALTGIKLYATALRQGESESDPELLRKLDAIATMADQALDGAQRILRGLGPRLLDQSGLVDALSALVAEHRRLTGQRCELKTSIDAEELAGPWTTSVFRVVQEALTNVAKHADADEVTVTINGDTRELTVEISDNGAGFDPDQPKYNGRLGLAGMRERALALNGQVTIETQPGKGTTVLLRVPLDCVAPPSSSTVPT